MVESQNVSIDEREVSYGRGEKEKDTEDEEESWLHSILMQSLLILAMLVFFLFAACNFLTPIILVIIIGNVIIIFLLSYLLNMVRTMKTHQLFLEKIVLDHVCQTAAEQIGDSKAYNESVKCEKREDNMKER